jgi:DNA/RNA-binding domain of Phe-tRNA-synthetase-like protein
MLELDLDVRIDLPGWILWWARLVVADVGPAPVAGLRATASERARESFTLERLSQHPTVSAVRALFRQVGCDPTRYRPSSEALLRRVLKGEDLPAIHPLVDLNNCISIALAVPACVIDAASVTPPFVLRAGVEGESMLSLRGQFNLAGKPLLADARGPFGTPITDSERVKVSEGTREALLVAYLPASVLGPRDAEEVAQRLLAEVTLATVVGTTATGGA